MEAAPVNGNKNFSTSTKRITIRAINNLKTDIQMFKAILQLPQSPLVNYILNPLLNALPEESNQIKYSEEVRSK